MISNLEKTKITLIFEGTFIFVIRDVEILEVMAREFKTNFYMILYNDQKKRAPNYIKGALTHSLFCDHIPCK